MNGTRTSLLANRSRPIRFVFFGVINTVFGYSIFVVAYVMSASHNLSILIATVIGIVFNYFTTSRYVFDNIGWRKFPMFVLSYVLSFSVNVALLNALISCGINPIVAQALSLPPTIIVSYLFNATISFRRTS
jgi:putative flippase GtrA